MFEFQVVAFNDKHSIILHPKLTPIFCIKIYKIFEIQNQSNHMSICGVFFILEPVEVYVTESTMHGQHNNKPHGYHPYQSTLPLPLIPHPVQHAQWIES